MVGPDRGRGCPEVGDLVRMVDDDPPHPVRDGPFQLGSRLGVPVQDHVLHREAGPPHEFEFAAGDDVDEPALPRQEPHEGPAQERLPGVGQPGSRPKGGAEADETVFEVTLVYDDQRRPEARGDVRQGQSADVRSPVALRP